MSAFGCFGNLHDSITVGEEDTDPSTSSDSFRKAVISSVPSVQKQKQNPFYQCPKPILILYYILRGYFYLNMLPKTIYQQW